MAATELPRILAAASPKVGRTRFIAVDGHGGSGKSTLATWLAEKLHASVVHTDDFASWDNPSDWWPLLVERVFEPIDSGATTLSFPRSKWWENHHPEPVVGLHVTEWMVLEGVGSSRRELRPYLSVCVFVETPKSTCLQRGIERDRATGKPEEELRRIWEGWLEAEDAYMRRDDPQQHADIVVDGTKPFDEQMLP